MDAHAVVHCASHWASISEQVKIQRHPIKSLIVTSILHPYYRKVVVVDGTNPNPQSWSSSCIISPWSLRSEKQSCFSEVFKISKILSRSVKFWCAFMWMTSSKIDLNFFKLSHSLCHLNKWLRIQSTLPMSKHSNLEVKKKSPYKAQLSKGTTINHWWYQWIEVGRFVS